MTRLRTAKIDGYKGLESLELDFKSVNIITGKNNSGKTSLLESIDLALNPTHLHNYSHHIDGLINIHKEEFSVDLDTENGKEVLQVRQTNQPNAVELYLETLPQSLDQFMSHYLYAVQFAEFEGKHTEIHDAVSEEIRDSISSMPPNFREKLSDNVYIVTHNDEEYPYIYFGPFHRDFMNFLLNERLENIKRALVENSDFMDDLEIELDDVIEHYIERMFSFYFNEGHFIREPNGKNRNSFIRSAKINRSPSNQDEEGAAVKKTEIRDYLEKHHIIEGIEDFDFDELVVEEDEGDRYSLQYEYMGDGFKSIVGILWQLLDQQDQNEIVLLEEPENHMHPGYVNELVPFLVRVAEEDDIQLFITTHNIDFIETFLSDNIVDKQQEYLNNNFQSIQLGGKLPMVLDYQESKEDVHKFHSDLRGT